MRLTPTQAGARLASNSHGVLCTVHPQRGPDPVPVMYFLGPDGYVGIPVDQVKPKTSSRLQREKNLASDPRAALLVERWDSADWSQLWWVRAHIELVRTPTSEITDVLGRGLADSVPQYQDEPFHLIMVFRTTKVTGWTAS